MNIWSDISYGVDLLRGGGVVGMPTETVYGLAGAIDQPEGIRKIFELKKRPFFDPLIVHVARKSQIETVAKNCSDLARFLAEEFWPGPLTMVLPKRDDLNPMITAGLETVGVRCPKHPVARRLISSTGSPLAAPSANLFGQTSPTTAAHVREEFGAAGLFVIDGGPCDVGLESTVLLIESGEEDAISILRPGVITRQILEVSLRKWGRLVKLDRKSSLASPGNLSSHYMPKIPLVIVPASQYPLNKAGLKRVQEALRFPVTKYEQLKLHECPVLVARSLYASLRELSSLGSDFIVAVRPEGPLGEEWDAIWDRISRAATIDLSLDRGA